MRAVCLTCVCLLMCPVIRVVLVSDHAGWDCILHYSWSYFLVDTSVSRVQQGVVTCLNLQQTCNSSFSLPGSFKGEIRMTWYKLRIIQDGEITIGQTQKHLEKDLCLGVCSVQNTSWLLCMLLLHNTLYILLYTRSMNYVNAGRTAPENGKLLKLPDPGPEWLPHLPGLSENFQKEVMEMCM